MSHPTNNWRKSLSVTIYRSMVFSR